MSTERDTTDEVFDWLKYLADQLGDQFGTSKRDRESPEYRLGIAVARLGQLIDGNGQEHRRLKADFARWKATRITTERTPTS